MKLIYESTHTKEKLPKGKLNVRHRQMRGVYQCFAGNTYLTGASEETADKAIEQLHYNYDVPAESIITIH